MPSRAIALALLTAACSTHLLASTAVTICFVNAGANGAHNGSSWTDAYTDPQTALANGACAEIWVAKSVYKGSFSIAPGIALYGGFAGGETFRSQRNPSANLTVLSGDVDSNDCGSGCPNGVATDATQIVGSNAPHVVYLDGTVTPIGASTVLDGFTITSGNASNASGGGLFCFGEGAGKGCSPTLANLVFSGNRASNVGGAIYDDGESGGASSPTLLNVVFHGNKAELYGGAMYNDAEVGTSSPVLTNVTFSANSASYGGAMYNDAVSGISSPVLDKVTFSGNSAVNFGGALFNVGNAGTSSPLLTNATFSGNSAKYGGAMFSVSDTGGTSSPVLTNVTFNGNSASLVGGAIDSYVTSGTSHPLLTNVILWGDSASSSGPEVVGDATINKSVVQGGCPAGTSCSNLVAGNPLLGALADNGGPTPTMQIGFGSVAIDSGDDGSCPATDQRGIDRPQGSHCDIGAIESERLFADGFDGAPAP